MLSQCAGPHLASGKLLFRETPGQRHAFRRGQFAGRGGVRYIYYIGEAKQLVETSHTEVRAERSFTILEDANCPAVLAEQCFVTSAADVAQFGSEEGCRRTARAYYEAICTYFEITPLPE